jgi:hypothetical protein
VIRALNTRILKKVVYHCVIMALFFLFSFPVQVTGFKPLISGFGVACSIAVLPGAQQIS